MAHGAGFNADFLTAFMFGLDMLQGRLYLPLAVYQRYRRTKTLKAILNESRMTSDWINVFGRTDQSDNLAFISVKSI